MDASSCVPLNENGNVIGNVLQTLSHYKGEKKNFLKAISKPEMKWWEMKGISHDLWYVMIFKNYIFKN